MMIIIYQNPHIARKDINFINDKMRLQLEDPQYTQLVSQLEADTRFFQENNLIDYSLLLGVYRRRREGNLPLSKYTIPLSFILDH